MEWMDELEKAVRRAPDMDGDGDGFDPDGEDGEGETPEAPMAKCGPMKKGGDSKGVYPAADNGDDTGEEGDAAVHDGDSLETANNVTGKKQKLYPKNQGGIKKSLGEEHQDAIDASDVLEGLVKSIDGLTGAQAAEIAKLTADVAQLTKGLSVIGKALVKSLSNQDDLVKSLKADVERVERQPAMRKSAVRTIDRKFNGDSGVSMPTKAERLQKSLAGVKAGLITPVEASIFESHSNRGEFRQDLWRKMGGE